MNQLILQKIFCDICRKKWLPRKKGIPRGVNKGQKFLKTFKFNAW